MEIKTSTQGSVVVVSMSGLLDAATSPEAERCIMELIEQKNTNLVLDLADLNGISSAGLRVCILADKELKARKGQLALCGLSDTVRRVFDVSGLSLRLNIYPTVQEAVAAIR